MKRKTPIIIAGVLALALVCGGGYLYVQNENAKAAEQVMQQEQAAAEKAEAEKLAAEQAAAEKAEADRLAAEQAAAEKAEADRLAAEQAAAEKAEADRLAVEQAAAEKAEADRLAAEQAPKPAENPSGDGKPDLNLSEGAHIPQTGDQEIPLDENGNWISDIPEIEGNPFEGTPPGGGDVTNDMTWDEIRADKAPNVY